jgi:hypothetical protein
MLYTMSSHRDICKYDFLGMITQCQRGVDTEAEWSMLHSVQVPPLADHPSNQILDHSIQNHPRTSQFAVIRRFIGIESHASEFHYRLYW